MISHFKGNKKPQLQKLYQDFLKILEAVGIPTNDLSDRAKEKMVGACLASRPLKARPARITIGKN